MDTSTQRPPLATAARALKLLSLFDNDNPELGVVELSRRLGVAKSMVSRIVTTFIADGVLEQDELTRRYRLGPLLLELGLIAGELHPVRQASDAALKSLRDETGQNTYIWLLDHGEALCLASYRGTQAMAPPIPAGTRRALSDLVAGLALEGLTRTAKEEGAARPRSGMTLPGGVCEIEPQDPQMRSAAASVCDVSGAVVAAVAVSAEGSWFALQSTKTLTQQVADAAAQVSTRLSGQA